MKTAITAFTLLVIWVASALAGKIEPGTVVYGVLPTVFGNEPIKSVTAKLDYLVDLGVDILWLSPIQPSDDPSAISYAISDYRALREDFGSPADLKGLILEAHARGLKVLIDFVPNHTSAAHPYFQDAFRRGLESPYHAFYARDQAGKPTHYFDWNNLPNLNYENLAVVDWMFENFAYWIREYDIDGFRMDAAWGMRQRSPQVWPELITRLSALKPDLIMLAEAGARDSYYLQNGFDLTYDWTDDLGVWAWKDAFKKPDRIAPSLYKLFSQYPPDVSTVRFLNNNDTGERFISRHGAPITRLAAILQHTLPGVSLVYVGDEVGAEFEPYEDPPPISWQDPSEMRPLYKTLASIRKSEPALREGDFRLIPLSDSPSVFAFVRSAKEQTLLVVLNFGMAATIQIPLNDLGPSPRIFVRVGEASYSVENSVLTIQLPIHSAIILAGKTLERS